MLQVADERVKTVYKLMIVEDEIAVRNGMTKNINFADYGFELVAAFDVAPDVVGTEVGGISVYHIDTLEEYMRANGVRVGVLTVPSAEAAAMAQRLADCGIKGIWNFTNMEFALNRPDVEVESVHFADSLLTLSYMISEE
jgi:redox-sensing transcriptional repressor